MNVDVDSVFTKTE